MPDWTAPRRIDLHGVATTLVRNYSIERVRLDEYKGGLSKTQLKRVLENIECSLDRDLTTSELAGLSRYRFGKMFKKSTSIPVHQYVVSRRIQRARDLLFMKRYSLAEIAFMTGFPSQSHFTTVFSSQTGLTPAVFRRAHRVR